MLTPRTIKSRFLSEGRPMSTHRERITIFDPSLRDGEQSPGCSMNQQEKLRVAHQLDRLGVDVIEAGFRIGSDGDCGSVKHIATVIRRRIVACVVPGGGP